VIISTGTKALQDQLYFRDVPFLETLVGELRVCYMKGRANYLCRHKLTALRSQPILSGLEEIDQYRQISEWEQTTESGDRAELSGMPESSALWQKLDARTEACLGSTCPDYRRCFITEMRRKALESDIIIVNHHLFFADVAVKREAAGAPDAGILPEAAAVVFDEAHELEDVASSYLRSWRATPMCFCAARKARKACPRSLSSCATARAYSLPACLWPAMDGSRLSGVRSFSKLRATYTWPCAPRCSAWKRRWAD
jgi:Rad3-related DNA helicase